MDRLSPRYERALFLAGVLCASVLAHGQCDQSYDWATWDGFNGNSSTGTIVTDEGIVSVTMSANYTFASTWDIYGYWNFSGFPDAPPNSTVPQTTWAIGPNGETTMCFSETVTNPALLISSLGNNNEIVTLEFSNAYTVVFNGSGMSYPDDLSIIGQEGYAIIVFPGELDCVTIYSSTPETYTNITWGLMPPLFDVTVTAISTTCGSATYTASGGSTYAWSGGSDPSAATNTFTLNGDYILTVTDDLGCTVVTSVQVEIPTGLTTTSSTSASACGSYTWNGETYSASGTYTFGAINSEGCDSIATLVLTINDAFFTESAISDCGYHIWNGDTLTSSGTYTLDTTTIHGCDSIATLHLEILHGSEGHVDISACDSYAAPDGEVYSESGVYEALIVSANGCDSLLTVNLTVNFSNSSAEARYTCDPLDVDTITYSFTTIHGCDSLHHIVPVQYPDSMRAHAAFTTGPAQVEIPDGVITIMNSSVNAATFQWDFGDGSPGSEASDPEHAYTDAGSHTITLIVTNELGCADTASSQILVVQDPLVFVPNCFTPNGDGLNEVFLAVFNGPERVLGMELRVFDRWGEELVAMDAPEDVWNGKYKGEPVQDGVYPWCLRYRIAGDSRGREILGHISVLR